MIHINVNYLVWRMNALNYIVKLHCLLQFKCHRWKCKRFSRANIYIVITLYYQLNIIPNYWCWRKCGGYSRRSDAKLNGRKVGVQKLINRVIADLSNDLCLRSCFITFWPSITFRVSNMFTQIYRER